MNLFKFISVKLGISLVLGILIGRHTTISPVLLFSFISLNLGLLGFLFFKKRNHNTQLFGLLFGITTIALGVLTYSMAQPKNKLSHYTNSQFENTEIWTIKIREVLKSNSFSDRYIASVQSAEGVKKSGKIILNAPIDSTISKFKVDDELLIYTMFSKIRQPLNPHQFDYASYLNDLGVYHQVSLNQGNYIKTKKNTQTIYGIAASTRSKIISKLQQTNFGKEELAIIQALILGQRNDISDETYDTYKNAGAVHVLALSGLHIGVILFLLQFILSPLEQLPKGKTLKLIVIVILLWGFAFLAGFSASIIRAVTMFSFIAYAIHLNRPTNMVNILALSLFFILLFNPMLLFQVGFQMSYAAVFAIVWVYPLLQNFWFPKYWILQKGWQLLSVSIAAQLGVLPISLFYFHQFPGLFFISNLLIVPFLGIILGLGILVVLLAMLNILPAFLASFYNTLIYLMTSVVGWVAQQEAFIFKNISFDWVQLLISYVIIISMVLVFTKTSFKRLAFLLIGIIGLQSWAFYQKREIMKKEQVVLLHQSRNTVLLHQKGKKLHLYTRNKSRSNQIIKNYMIAEHSDTLIYDSLQNNYQIQNKKLLIIDSTSIYSTHKVNYILMTQSPKINLERLVDSVQPKMIIADGTNYKTYISRWKETCKKRKLPFHYTGEKGAYYFIP
ncbi:competence protein ComEC [Saonia flava]|uniref:Competence protein ComEC n=1 Tax=Saonia flava TaxID=523696 RepID=A0A846R521_9FLAO|nr:ComEC/Rec2 family competence protein [Saonia flava]NJB71889.1 competence protein ComEC [Saonia flava]